MNTGSTSRKRRASTSSADGGPPSRRRTDQSSDNGNDDQNSETETGEGILGLEEDNNNEVLTGFIITLTGLTLRVGCRNIF
jgi:hypothetical protein